MQPVWMDNKAPGSEPTATQAPLSAPRQSLVRSLFSLHSPPTEWTRVHNSESFGQLPFCGGEEEAQDHWHDKWEAHRRMSLDEADRMKELAAVAAGAGVGGVGGKGAAMTKAMRPVFHHQFKRHPAGLAAPGEVYEYTASSAAAAAAKSLVSSSSNKSAMSHGMDSSASKSSKSPSGPSPPPGKAADIYESTFWA